MVGTLHMFYGMHSFRTSLVRSDLVTGCTMQWLSQMGAVNRKSLLSVTARCCVKRYQETHRNSKFERSISGRLEDEGIEVGLEKLGESKVQGRNCVYWAGLKFGV
ncbi:hypothetical protein LTR65_001099 [Meristemomyces frigidus]